MWIQRLIGATEDVHSPEGRQKVGNRAALIGLVTNLILFSVKLFAGFITNSIAVIGDAINNLTDAGSSILTLLSFRFSAKPPDENHPFGHARYEYLFSSIAAIIILFVGFQLGLESWNKIRQPEAVLFSRLALNLLLASILAKIGLFFFYRRGEKEIKSDLLHALAVDSLADVLSSGAIVLSLIAFKLFGWNIDGWVGLAVAVIILKAGFDILRDAVHKLLGEPASPERIQEVEDFVLAYPGIHGVHDLIIHDYGPGRNLASIHAEVNVHSSFLDMHKIIDKIEYDAKEALGLELLIHMDPIDPKDPRLDELARFLEPWFARSGYAGLSFHDLRMIDSYYTDHVVFEIEIPSGHTLDLEEMEHDLQKDLESLNPRYKAVISYDEHTQPYSRS